MKKLIMLLIVSCIASMLVFPAVAHGAMKTTPFQEDNPFFITAGKVVIPASQPTWTGYYTDGRVQCEFYPGTILWGWFQSGTSYTYLDEEPRDGKGRVSTVTMILNPASRPSYNITYYGDTSKVNTVTYVDNYWGNKQVWEYNKDGTIKGYDSYYTTGANYGRTMLQSQHVEYTYERVKGGNIEATKTTNSYVYNPVYVGSGQYRMVLDHINTEAETVVFDIKELMQNDKNAKGEFSSAGDIKDFIEKQDILNKIFSDKKALGDIKVTSSIAQENTILSSAKEGIK
jgi:hypothetical protein